MFLLLCVLLDGEGDYQSPLPSGCLPCGSCLGVPSYRIFISFLGITHLWELEHKVETDIKPRRLSSWVSLEGAPRRSCPYSGCTHRCQGDDKQLAFRDPETFIAGEIHNHHDVWTNLTYLFDIKQLIMDWITNGVSISPYIRHFKGVFKGISYDHEFPPGRVFQNHPSCQQFGKFISPSLESRLETVTVIGTKILHTIMRKLRY